MRKRLMFCICLVLWVLVACAPLATEFQVEATWPDDLLASEAKVESTVTNSVRYWGFSHDVDVKIIVTGSPEDSSWQAWSYRIEDGETTAEFLFTISNNDVTTEVKGIRGLIFCTGDVKFKNTANQVIVGPPEVTPRECPKPEPLE